MGIYPLTWCHIFATIIQISLMTQQLSVSLYLLYWCQSV